MKKICLFLCCIFVMSLTACGNSGYPDAVKPDDMSEEHFQLSLKYLRIIDDRLLGKTTAEEYENKLISMFDSVKESKKTAPWSESETYEKCFSFQGDVLICDDKRILTLPVEWVKETVDGRNNLALLFFIPPIKFEDTHGYAVLNKYLPQLFSE